MTFHNPATATLEEARHVIEEIRKRLTWANGEWASELRADLETWQRVVERLEARVEVSA